MLVERYLHKAILVVESTQEWLRLHEAAHPPSEQEAAEFEARWTGRPVQLLEMAMSLHENRVINDGEVPITAVVRFFFHLFHMKPGNFFASYGVMRTRAKSRTIFLDDLKAALERKMDKDDEVDSERRKS